MATLFPLSDIQGLRKDFLDQEISSLGEGVADLRGAIEKVITGIHGLPDVLDLPLKRISVYLGRAGATSKHVYGRWKSNVQRHDELSNTNSYGLILFKAKTSSIKTEKWERVGIRFVEVFKKHRGLCCANVHKADPGSWPKVKYSVVYLIVCVKRGRAAKPPSKDAIKSSVVEALTLSETSQYIDLASAAKAGLLIHKPDEHKTPHQLLEESRWVPGLCGCVCHEERAEQVKVRGRVFCSACFSSMSNEEPGHGLRSEAMGFAGPSESSSRRSASGVRKKRKRKKVVRPTSTRPATKKPSTVKPAENRPW